MRLPYKLDILNIRKKEEKENSLFKINEVETKLEHMRRDKVRKS